MERKLPYYLEEMTVVDLCLQLHVFMYYFINKITVGIDEVNIETPRFSTPYEETFK